MKGIFSNFSLRRGNTDNVFRMTLSAYPEYTHDIKRQSEQILGQRMLMSASTSFLGYGTQAFMLRNTASTLMLAAWVVALLVVESTNGTVAYIISRQSTSDVSRKNLIYFLIAGLGCVGSVWGAVVLMPGVSEQPTQLLVQSMGLAVAGIMGVYNLNLHRICLAAFNVGLGSGLVYGWLVLHTVPMELGIASIAVTFMCQIYGTAARRLVHGMLISNAINCKIAKELETANLELTDMTERLQKIAATDPLTGCLNRRAFSIEMQKELERCKRTGTVFCIIALDLDHFKSVNDQFGHAGGDKVLITISTILQNEMRAVDAIGRWGGEEFMCLLTNADQSAGRKKAEAIRVAIARTPIQVEEGFVNVSVSIGVATYRPGVSIDELIKTADDRLYEAKRSGRNRVCS
ncbi:GGDEF domain-containing protein [Paraburkholderia sp. MMS20-SJTR3]|uniref:diguanylate cyclase n=1 Tax=Paraburkholderia sejongensis TaxID=2886946 RepID=A0ABS8K5Y3_9BURK|nr:GGDEF domain-containing protein [Paraburkholderia sp. MMS20-SJTR3]MCC8397577.1 GGDEF domain-containing protein [Paraburkholderia sp. MMS20-SJTR3]